MEAWIKELQRDWKRLLRKHWKRLYWLGLISFLSYLVGTRFSSIVSGNPTNMDIIVFIIWVALIVVPLFREVNIFGVGWKSEIQSLRNDFRGEMLNLRSEIQNTINFRQQIIVGQLPTDAELRSTEKRIKPALEKTLKELDIEGSVSVTKETEIPDTTQLLFSIRYTIENELTRIWNSWAEEMHVTTYQELGQLGRFPRTIPQLVSSLADLKVIDSEFVKPIRDINTICSSAIHGGDVTKVKVKFIRDVAPGVIAYLRSIRSGYDSAR